MLSLEDMAAEKSLQVFEHGVLVDSITSHLVVIYRNNREDGLSIDASLVKARETLYCLSNEDLEWSGKDSLRPDPSGQ